MTISMTVMLITISILYAILLFITIRQKKRITCMTGMMVSMAMGMCLGLIFGIILGVYYSGNLFISTVIGMGIGMIAGLLPGLPISIMAVLDGILSGAMAGMMGAMLGDMLMTDYRDTIVKLMFLLFVFTLLIIFYVLSEDIGSNNITFFHNPLILAILITVFFLVFNQLGPVFPENWLNNNSNQGENKHAFMLNLDSNPHFK